MLLFSFPALTATPIGKLTKAFKLATPELLVTDELLLDEEMLDAIELITEDAKELAILEVNELETRELATLELIALDCDDVTLDILDELRELVIEDIEDDAPTIPKGAG